MSLCQSGLSHGIQISALMTALIMQSTQGRRLGKALNAHQQRQPGLASPTVSAQSDCLKVAALLIASLLSHHPQGLHE